LPQLTAPKSLFRYQSGRVIALGRVMLVTCFLIAVLLDRSEAAQDIAGTYLLLVFYGALAIVIAVATWRNWWLDARLAVATHALDMAVFTAIVFSTNGSTSPFFLFFVLPLLSAAIRWSWRETALTATALVVLHLIAGLLVAGSQTFEIERFVVRSGHLMILSLLLIWFGVHQRFTRLQFPIDDAEAAAGEERDPLIQALRLARSTTQAGAGALVVGPLGEESCDGIAIVHGERRALSGCRGLATGVAGPALLFNLRGDHALTRAPEGHFQFAAASARLDIEEIRRLGATEGLVVEVRTGTQQGWLALWDVPDLSTDFIDFGGELGRAVGGILDRHALLTAIETGAAARTRLSLARDVHDSVVQFLAGASFRVEAIKRSAKDSPRLGAELDELKRLLVEEQGEVRGFVLALRKGRELELAEAAAELRALAERLSQQWSVKCQVKVGGEEAAIPVRLQLDLQQLLREAVANAVRHGGADRIDVALAVDQGQLSLNVHDNGSGFPKTKGAPPLEPRSLKERVERAHGSLRLESAPGSTDLHISIPLGAAA
jgi:signal transduction histidine kinase